MNDEQIGGADDGYAAYEEWKSWDSRSFMRLTVSNKRYYADELRGHPLRGRKVLEIGFGNGNFLAWAKEQGAELYGTEAIPELCERARQAGVTVLPMDLAGLTSEYRGEFAAIAAFDVMEHLTIEENRGLLAQIAMLLEDGGVFIARYPNGQSPFGRVHQYGDVTHRSVLSAGIMSQLVAPLPFDVVHLGNPAGAKAAGVRRMGSMARNLLQKTCETLIGKLYGQGAPLGPNSIAYLRRRPRQSD